MNKLITPGICSGQVHIPPSKSMAHRSIICAALAKGKSRIDNIDYSKDIDTTIEGMRALGAEITLHDDFIEIDGIKDFKHLKSTEIFCNESGSSLRFFLPIFSLSEQTITFTGAGRLMERPQNVYEDLFHELGLTFIHTAESITIKGAIQSGDYVLDGNVSSQFISGLLFALPLCKGNSTITIKKPFESKSYVDLTMQMLEYFGVETDFSDDHTIYIKGNQSYHAGCYTVEGDYSQFAFFAVLAALNHDLTVTGVSKATRQGDQAIIDILKQANVEIEDVHDGFLIHKSDVTGCEIDLADCPDLGPILCVLGAFAKGKTHIRNAGRLRLKESDRIWAMESELRKLGVEIRSCEQDITITGKHLDQCRGVKDQILAFDSHNDHRIAMSMSVAATLCQSRSFIVHAEAVNKSYPQFFDDLRRIGIEVSDVL
ncbi:MAG: 3-phosphoshikimate 1-carboxyvinyltransferase [Erysipelotrichaceae bacterium]|nr:3-phosphoshikimate 1-carboxyvinyltransferase [Erysipelotrichaceae bacterium]